MAVGGGDGSAVTEGGDCAVTRREAVRFVRCVPLLGNEGLMMGETTREDKRVACMMEGVG